MPAKKGTKPKAKKVEVVVEAPVVKKAKKAQDPRRCFNCNKVSEFRCKKGDNNEFGFCSVECFNEDK